MKIVFAICLTVVILSVSCKKSNEQLTTHPVIIDTVKPPVIKPDTSTLLKLSWTYNYDPSGTVTVDSFLTQWQYDGQRRIILMTSEASGFTDTSVYTYSNDHYTVNTHTSFEGSPNLVSNYVYYQHIRNHTDSILYTSTGYGSQAGNYSSSAIYFYYNQNIQDTLEETISSNNGGTPVTSTLNYFYTGSDLDSTVYRDNNGKLFGVRYFTDGNQTTDFYFNDGVPAGVLHFTYTNISSGGLNIIYPNPQLMSGYTSITIPATTTFVETDTYQMDSVNRVTAMLIYRNSSSLTQKQVFRYY